MLYEIAYIRDGELVRGGISASLRTIGRWIESNQATDPDTVYMAVPSSADAIPVAVFNAQCEKGCYPDG